MMPDRSDKSALNSAKVMSKFLTVMQSNAGLQVFIIGCTNYPERMDAAFRRRFQRLIKVKLTDAKS
jgi:SpoVK/Ycf46/Vps4 family AAA+-type ATPase